MISRAASLSANNPGFQNHRLGHRVQGVRTGPAVPVPSGSLPRRRASFSSAWRVSKVSAARAMRFIISTVSRGYSPTAVSPESMQASAPSRIALETSATSARVGSPRVLHAVEHLRGDDHRLPLAAALGDDPLLGHGHLGNVDLHAQVAAGDHHAVGRGHDRRQVFQGLGLLDLGDDVRPAVARSVADAVSRSSVRKRPRRGGQSSARRNRCRCGPPTRRSRDPCRPGRPR